MVPDYWWPYLYQYGVGAVIFAIGIWLILSHGSCVLARRQDRFWFGVLIAGFLGYAGVHLAWYLLAIYWNPAGAAGAPAS